MQQKVIKSIVIFIIVLFSINGYSQDIFTFIRQGNIEKVKELIEADSLNVTTKNARGFSPIHFATNFNKLEIAKLLVANGANPFTEGPAKRQPIHWAASTGSIEIVNWLYSLGADLNVLDEENKSPIYLAATRRRKECVEYLLSQNVEIQTEGEDAFNLLYFSVLGNLTGIVDKFNEVDFDFKQKTVDGSSLILAAALNGNVELIKMLAKKNLDVNLLNEFGECALHLSIIHNNFEAMKTLIELGADINSVNFISQNALNFADKSEDDTYSTYLKSKGATAAKEFVLTSDYPGFEEPGMTAKLLAPGLISTADLNERDAMFSPDMKEFYFSATSPIPRKPMAIKKMIKNHGMWSAPETANFSGKFNDAECFVSFDNRNLYFISQRPPQGGERPSSWEIWLADRAENGDWENFRLMDSTILKGCFYPSLTKDGEFLYTGVGNDIYLSKLIDEKVTDIQKLGPEINTEGGEYNAMISPDGDYIITTSHGFEDHYGGGDLYISFRMKDNSWSQAINMGPEVNTENTEYCPNISPDGKFFFFTSNKKGTEDIYWVSAKIIELLKEEIIH